MTRAWRWTALILWCFASSAVGCGDSGGDDKGSGGNGSGADASAENDAAASGGDVADCANLTGTWKLTSWTCAGTPFDVAAVGVEIMMSFTSPTSGSETLRFFVPTNQKKTWFARTQGRTASLTGEELTITGAAPIEACSTDSGAGADWGPVMTGIGEESCNHNVAEPSEPDSRTFGCAASKDSIALTHKGSRQDGPCKETEESIQTWSRQ